MFVFVVDEFIYLSAWIDAVLKGNHYIRDSFFKRNTVHLFQIPYSLTQIRNGSLGFFNFV